MFVVFACHTKGELVLCWTSNISVTIKSYYMSHIAALTAEHNSDHEWDFVGFYRDTVTSTRYTSWCLLNRSFTMPLKLFGYGEL